MNSLPNIPYEIIQKAVKGDEKALQYVLDIFYPYIRKLATTHTIDKRGVRHANIDEDMIAYIQSRLVMEIMHGFEIRS